MSDDEYNEMDNRIVPLLSQLNAWEQKYGPLGAGRNLESTGEVTARIEELKRQIRELGADISWNGREYIVRQQDTEDD